MNSRQFGKVKLVIALVVTTVVLLACDREQAVEPPTIHFGEDVCDVCHMIISDERYAAGLVTQDETGRRTQLAFDDIGCAFEFEAQHPERPVEAVFVRDLRTQQWLDAEAAHFVHSRDLHTPMAFGLAALADEGAAGEVHERYGGNRIDLTEARGRFRRGVLHVEKIDPEQSGANAGPQGAGETGDESAADNEAVVFELNDGTGLQLFIEPRGIVSPGKHPFVITVQRATEADEWAPADDFDFQIEPTMPSMGHGSPGNEHPERADAGRFVGLVNFTMSGRWVVDLTVMKNGESVGETSIEFKVER